MECTQQADIDPDEDLDMEEEDAAESDSSGDASEGALEPGDALLAEEVEIDSDYEDECPPPKPAHRRGKRKRAAIDQPPEE